MANIGTIVDNSRTINLASGAKCVVPKVALATSWAVLEITNATAGANYTVTCNGQAIKITIGTTGKAKMSLQPFMRDAATISQELPLPTDGGSRTAVNKWRGILTLVVSLGAQSTTIQVPAIYGGANPNIQVADRWIDYIDNEELLGTWVTLDLAEWYNDDGTLNMGYQGDWLRNNFNLNEYLDNPPTGDSVEQFEVAMFNRGRISFAPLDIHLRYQCRSENIMQVKWLDAEGNINTRLFTYAGVNEGASTDDSYNRFHWTKEKLVVGDGYWAGADRWSQRKATKQITLGDDNIPNNQFSWLVSLVQSSCVEVWAETSHGAKIWQRCNIVDTAIERDPRKDTFSVTLAFELTPVYEPQQF